MSRASVREAVSDYLSAPAVTGLQKVHSAKPRNWKPSDIVVDASTPSAAAGYLHIEGVVEQRVATGKKQLDYTVVLVYLFRSSQNDSVASMHDFDVLTDAIKAKLRTKTAYGQVLGLTGSPEIFNAAEKQLMDETDLPQESGGMSSVWSRLRFEVSEMINA